METQNNSDDDVQTIESNSSIENGDDKEKPLMKLIRRLVSDSKQNTVLTNSQLISIMRMELDINVAYLHELERDIYMTIIKKYLKDWPRWDQFEQMLNNSKQINSSKDLEELWLQEYQTLKKYLKKKVDMSKPLAKEAVNKYKAKHQETDQIDNDDDIVMEVFATRSQLNKVVQRYPTKGHNIFKLCEPMPVKIRCKMNSLLEVLNWPEVILSVGLGGLVFKRQIRYNLEHLLLDRNRPGNSSRKKTKCNTNMQMCCSKNVPNVETPIKLENVEAIQKSLYEQKDYTSKEKKNLNLIFLLVQNDLVNLPKKVKHMSFFQQSLVEYPLVRSLYSEPEQNFKTDQYKLEIEEKCIPKLQINIVWFEYIAFHIVPEDWLKISCEPCNVLFSGSNSNFFDEVLNHFNEHHIDEPDWTCTNCNKVMSMTTLTLNRWKHDDCHAVD